MCIVYNCRRIYQFEIAMIVRTTVNEKIKYIFVNKRSDNNSFLSTKNYSYLNEQIKKCV